MKELTLNAAEWQTKDDVYDAFFRAVGAPNWHGRNFDALNDSIAKGSINQVEVPYRLIIRNFGKVGEGARQMSADFVGFIQQLAERGCPVAIRIE